MTFQIVGSDQQAKWSVKIYIFAANNVVLAHDQL